MNKPIVLIVVLLFLATSCIIIEKPVWATSGDSWLEKSPMNQARGRLGVASVNGKIYAIGGDAGSIGGLIGSYVYDGTSLVVNSTEEYNPATDTWVIKAPMPTPRDHFGIAAYENKIYCIGGMTPTQETGANEVYYPTTDTWEIKASMPTPARFLTANVVNDKIYVISTMYSCKSLTQVYDPATDSWTTKTSPPYRITSSASAAINDKIYVIADNFTNPDASSPPSFVPESAPFVQIYDTDTNSWSFGGPSPSNMDVATAGVTSGVNAPERIYFFDENPAVNATYVYNPPNGSWSTGAVILTARSYVGVAVLNDIFYTVGGVIFPTSGSGTMSPSPVNQQYTPIGYGTISIPSQLATASPSPSPSQIRTPSTSPTAEPTSLITPQPTPSDSSLSTNNNSSLQANVVCIGTAAVIVIAVIVGVAVVFRQKKTALQTKNNTK